MNELKPWYESKTLWVGIVAILGSVFAGAILIIGVIRGIDISALDALIGPLSGIIVGILTIIFRGNATKRIGKPDL